MDTRCHRFLLSGRILDVPFKLDVGILLGVGAYSMVGADSVLYGIRMSEVKHYSSNKSTDHRGIARIKKRGGGGKYMPIIY